MPDRPRSINLSRAIRAWQPNFQTQWSVYSVRNALLALREGSLQHPSMLFDSMLEDDEMLGTLQKRVNATLRSEFRLLADKNEGELTPAQQELQDAWEYIAPDGDLFEIVSNWIMLGVGIGTLDWYRKDDRWVCNLRSLPTEFLEYDHEENCWYYQTRENPRLKVTPGDGKWFVLANGERPWMFGLIRSLALLWLGKQMTLGDWQTYNAKHGLPIFKAMVPNVSPAEEKDNFLEDLQGLQSEGVIGCPVSPDGQASYDVELLEARDTSWQSFPEALERADRKIQVALLGSNIGTEQSSSTGGSRAAAETSAKGLDKDKARSDARFLGLAIQEQLIQPLFAQNGIADEAPMPFWDTCPEEDAREWADARQKYVAMLAALPMAGYKLDNFEELSLEYGMQLSAAPIPTPDAPAPGPGEKKPAAKKEPSE